MKFPLNFLYFSIPLCLMTTSASYGLDIGVKQIQEAQLGQQFTLKYSVVRKDVSTIATKKLYMNLFRKTMDYAVKNQGWTRAEADDRLQHTERALQRPPKPRYDTITVSAWGGTLLILDEQPKEITVFIFDDTSTSTYVQAESRSCVRPGLELSPTELGTLPGFPLPGVGVPHLPLTNFVLSQNKAASNETILSASIPDFQVAGPITYHSGTITVLSQASKLKILSTSINNQGIQGDKYDYTDHHLTQGSWLPSHFRLTKYDSPEIHQDRSSVMPETISDWQLKSFKTQPLPADWFNITHWLKFGTQVEYGTGEKTVNFSFDPSGGDLKQQAARQLDAQRKLQGVDRLGSIRFSNTTKLFLIAIVFAIAGLSFWRRMNKKNL